MNYKKIMAPSLMLLFLNADLLPADGSAFFSESRKQAQQKTEELTEHSDINQDAAYHATIDAATVAQAATNVGININNQEFTEILYQVIKKYGIEYRHVQMIAKAAISAAQADSAQGFLIAQTSDIPTKEAKQLSQQTIAAYACLLAQGEHPKVAEAAACKVANIKSLPLLVAQRIAEASATDAGIIARTKGLAKLVLSITSQRVKKLLKNTKPLRQLTTHKQDQPFHLISVSKKGRIFIRINQNGRWVPNENELEASCEVVQSLDINDRGCLWMVSKIGNITFQDGITIDDDKIAVEGSAKQIATNNNGVVWMVSTDGKLYYREGIRIGKEEGDRWVLVYHGSDFPAQKVSWLSLNDHNELVVIADGKAYVRKGTDQNPRGNGWLHVTDIFNDSNEDQPTTDALREIVINNQRDIWALNVGNKIFFRKGIDTKDLQEQPWLQIPGASQTLMLSPDETLWVIDTKSHLFKRTGCTAKTPQGTNWQYLMTAPAFARLFVSPCDPHNPLDEYKADQSRRERRRMEDTSIERLRKRITLLEKDFSKAPRGIQRKILKQRIYRLKELGRKRFDELRDKQRNAWLKEFELLKKGNPHIMKAIEKQKAKANRPKAGTYSAIAPQRETGSRRITLHMTNK